MWKDILKEDRSGNKVTITYIMPDNTKHKLGPFPFDEFDEKFDTIPEEAQIGIITEEVYRNGEWVAAKIFNKR
jgi:hypothetical protein